MLGDERWEVGFPGVQLGTRIALGKGSVGGEIFDCGVERPGGTINTLYKSHESEWNHSPSDCKGRWCCKAHRSLGFATTVPRGASHPPILEKSYNTGILISVIFRVVF